MSAEAQEFALESRGCLISFSSCGHKEIAASKNIIDGSRSTFWTTTGLYPHSFIVSFPKLINLSSITIRSYCVRNMLIEKCAGDLSSGFVKVKNVDMPLTDLHHQVSKVDLDSVSVHHLRFIIKDGFQEFCAIYKVCCNYKSAPCPLCRTGKYMPQKHCNTKPYKLKFKTIAGRGVGQAVKQSFLMWLLRPTRM